MAKQKPRLTPAAADSGRAASWRARLASIGVIMHANLASPAAAAALYVTLRGCYAKPIR